MAEQVGAIEVKASLNTRDYTSGADQIDKDNKRIEKSSDNVDKSNGTLGKSFSTLGKGIAIAAAAAAAATVAATVVFVQQASEIQSLRASFLSLTGSVEDTNAVMTTLADLSKRTAFQNKDIQAAGRNFLAAGVSIKDLNKVLSATADVAGATGADLGALTLPLTQAIARGKLQTQDFYQLLNSGAGALRKPLTELAGSKGFGSLAEALEAGAITSEDLLEVMQKVTKQGGFAFEGALKQSKTFNGQMSNLLEAIGKVGLAIIGVDSITGEIKIGGVFDTLSKAVGAATDALSKFDLKELTKEGTFLGDVFRGIAAGFKIFMQILIPIIKFIQDLFVELSKNKEVMDGLKVIVFGLAIALGAIIIVGVALIGILGLIAAGVANLIGQIAKFVGQAVIGFMTAYNAVVSFFSGLISWGASAWSQIQSFFGGIGSWFAARFNEARNAIVNAFNGMISFVSGVPGRIVSFFGGIGVSIAQAIRSAINSFLRLPLRIPTINVAGKTFGGQTLIPALAEGGIVSSATLAMVGEGKEPEAVIPLSKLESMIGGNFNNNSQGVQVGTIIIQRDVDIDLVAQKLGIKQLNTRRGVV